MISVGASDLIFALKRSILVSCCQNSIADSDVFLYLEYNYAIRIFIW